jgi:ubiquinone/menaquinone biosynthesis C-methylase UbiE
MTALHATEPHPGAAAPPHHRSPRGTGALYDLVLALGERRVMRALRAGLLAGAGGRTVEIGAGTGLNVAHYPETVSELVLTEPDAEMARRLRRRAGAKAVVVEAEAAALPFADASADTVVSTLVLCTVPDPEAVVAELRRVLRPGGSLLFVEHVAANTPRAVRAQRRWARPWAAVAGGCRCDRDTLATLERHFEIAELSRPTWRGMPSIVQPLIVGRAA